MKQCTNVVALFSASTVRMRVNTSVKLPMLNWAPVAVVNEKSVFKVCVLCETPHAFLSRRNERTISNISICLFSFDFKILMPFGMEMNFQFDIF